MRRRPALLLLAALLLQASLAAAAPAAQGAKSDDGIEEVEPTKVAPHAAPGRALELLGKLHPLLVHLPIGWLVLGFVVDAMSYLRRRRHWARVGWPLLLGSVLLLIPTVVTGLLRARSFSEGAAPRLLALLTLHRNLALLLAGLAILALLLRSWRRNQLEGGWRAAYLLLLLGMLVLLPVVGHLGGKLVFGEGYLPF